MTDGLSQNQTPATATPIESEKKFSQDEVNYLISKVKAEAKQSVQHQIEAAPKQDVSLKDIEELVEKRTEEKIKSIQQQYVTSQQEQVMKQAVDAHYQTINSAKKIYSDFDEVVGTINFGESPALIPLIQSMPNKEAVMYHLGKEDERFNQINFALQSKQYAKAESLMKKFADSIQKNEEKAAEAKKTIQPKEPLSQLKPSTTGVDGAWDVKSLKKMLKR